MGCFGRMFAQQKMDASGLTGLLGDRSKMALAGSPDAAAIVQQLSGAQDGSGAVSGVLKKLMGE